MAGKHLKKLRAEKSKVHLKKKRLPKGENLTNTAFTVKKILTVEQLQKVDKNEPVSSWNVPLKELLLRLNHYNFTSRLNGLTGIRELITKYPEILRGSSLKHLISKLLELITDEEHKIRVTTTDLLSDLFDLISLPSITAFHKILNLHLGCAMTHRNTSVQQDSLNLIDVIIKHSPEVIKCNFKLIAQNFMRIMKSYFYESYSGVFSSKKSKQDLEKVKKEMLHRFYQFIVTGYPKDTEKKPCYYTDNSVDVFVRQKVSLRDFSNEYKKIPDLSSFKNPEKNEKLLDDFNSNEFMKLCSQVIPLLFDIWVEFCPNQTSDGTSECVLTEIVGDLLAIILKILLFLYEMVATFQDTELERWFTSNYGQMFKKSFILNFPYLPTVCTKISKCSNPEQNFSSSYTLQNLIICYLAYSLNVMERNSKLETKIENYVIDALTTGQKEIEMLLKVVEAGIHASKYKKSNPILSRAVATYTTTVNPAFRRSLSKVLMSIASDENKCMYHADQEIMNWMKSLPDCLCQLQVFVEEIETVLKLITTPTGAVVLREIEFKAEEILENLQDINVEGINQTEGKKMIANVLYRCSRKVLMEIMEKKILEKRIHHQDLKNYISGIFLQKLTNYLGFCEV